MNPIAITIISNIKDYVTSRTLSTCVNYRIFTYPNGRQHHMIKKLSSVAILLILLPFTPRSRKLTDNSS